MKSESKTGNQYTAFENMLRRVVQVPHSEIKAKLEAEKQSKADKRTPKKDRKP